MMEPRVSYYWWYGNSVWSGLYVPGTPPKLLSMVL